MTGLLSKNIDFEHVDGLMKYLWPALLLFSVHHAGAYAEETDGNGSSSADYSQMSDAELVKLVRDPDRSWLSEPCAIGQPLFETLWSRNSDNSQLRHSALFLGVLCDDKEQRFEDAAARFAKLEDEFGSDDMIDLGLYLDTRTENADRALTRLAKFDSETLKSLDATRYWNVARMIVKQGQNGALDEIALDWWHAGYFGSLDLELQADVAIRAMTSAIKKGETKDLSELLSYVRGPSFVLDLLADRRFEPIWPLLEERAGPNLDLVSQSYAEWAIARLENEKTDRDRFSEAAHALHFAGRFSEAIDLARQWYRREERGREIQEGDGWALNIEAFALDALGRYDEADAVFDQLAELDPDEHPWVVNFVINRASRLVGQERWQEGLAATDLARSVAEDYGSTYAKMLIARDRTCALKHLGRIDETGPEVEFLRANSKDSASVSSQGLMCLGLDDEAADVLIAAVKDDAKRSALIADFQNEEFELFYTPSKLRRPRDLLETYPELRAEVEKYIRRLPSELTPIASLKRKQRYR